jgi:diacylglycerol kinase family enzyme
MIAVIVNPVAGSGLAATVGQKVDALLTQRDVTHTMLYTQRAGHATELAKACAAEGVETVLSVGGDGTLNETAAGLVGTQTALGIIPAGTGNDFIKALGTPQVGRSACLHPAKPRAPAGYRHGERYVLHQRVRRGL